MGIETMEAQLNELGYSPIRYQLCPDFRGFKYIIPHGKFRNTEVEIALQVPPDFPLTPPSGPYIKPFLLPIKTDGNSHPYDRIWKRDRPTTEFQYWSRPFNGWSATEKNMRVYRRFLNTLFDFE